MWSGFWSSLPRGAKAACLDRNDAKNGMKTSKASDYLHLRGDIYEKEIPEPGSIWERKEELLALKRSIAELGAIGRNLNQIARAVNSGERVSLPGRQELLTMLKIGEGLREHVKALLKANTASWSVAECR